MNKNVQLSPSPPAAPLSLAAVAGLATVVLLVAGLVLFIYEQRIRQPQKKSPVMLLTTSGAIQFPHIIHRQTDVRPDVPVALRQFVLVRAQNLVSARVRYDSGAEGTVVTYQLPAVMSTAHIYQAYRRPQNLKDWKLLAGEYLDDFAFFDLENSTTRVRVIYRSGTDRLTVNLQTIQK